MASPGRRIAPIVPTTLALAILVAVAAVATFAFEAPADVVTATSARRASTASTASGVAVGAPAAPVSAMPTVAATAAPISFGGPAKPLPPGGLYDGIRPPQFVLVSFDGAADPAILERWLMVSRQAPARMSFFLSLVYLLDPERRELYQGPRYGPGESAIGFAPGRPAPEFIRDVVVGLQAAQRAGHEVAMHYAGHWCGASGVRSWNAQDWEAELDSSFALADDADANNGLSPPVGSVYLRPPIGSRTPCLDGDLSLLFPVLAGRGFRYDASGTRGLHDWPTMKSGLWSFGFPTVAVAGSKQQLLMVDYSMDVNIGKRNRPQLVRDVASALVSAIDRLLVGNRAPFEMANHFTELAGGAYNDAVEQFVRAVCPRSEVHCVSYRELTAWLDEHADRLGEFGNATFGI